MKKAWIIIFLIAGFLNGSTVLAQSPLRLNNQNDMILSAVSLVLAGSGSYLNHFGHIAFNQDELQQLSRLQVNQFDRPATYNWNKKYQDASDVLLATAMAAPVGLLFSDAVHNDGWPVTVIYGQTMLIVLGMNQLVKIWAGRARPYVYNDDPAITTELKMSSHAKKSFYSGHAAMAFASVAFLATTYDGYFPGSDYHPWIWGGGILLAGSVAVLRVLGGVHYLSDVIVGALAGGLTGYLVPKLHQQSISESSQREMLPQLRFQFRF
jgi:membrane-associated phospholipid phosphatase